MTLQEQMSAPKNPDISLDTDDVSAQDQTDRTAEVESDAGKCLCPCQVCLEGWINHLLGIDNCSILIARK